MRPRFDSGALHRRTPARNRCSLGEVPMIARSTTRWIARRIARSPGRPTARPAARQTACPTVRPPAGFPGARLAALLLGLVLVGPESGAAPGSSAAGETSSQGRRAAADRAAADPAPRIRLDRQPLRFPDGAAPAERPAPAPNPERRASLGEVPAAGPVLPHPILFVTQVPVPADFTTIGSVFGNHSGDVASCARGGDLWIRYGDGTTRNLTAAAGYGNAGFQGAGSIAVRGPAVHWNGTKAVFSMVIGATEQQYQYEDYYWQLYEITGLGQNQTPVITKVANQPADFNNVDPTYGSDDRILFTSDRPRSGERHLYPQLDEYEEAPVVSGLWSLDPASGDLRLLDHAPSGDFTPFVDSFGRVVFTRWDHLQRDQQADAQAGGSNDYGIFDFADESATAAQLPPAEEVFPEPRSARQDLLAGTNLTGHEFNHFLPWTVEQDGRELEILNHLGRHELHEYFDRTMNDDDNLVELIDEVSGRLNPRSILNFLQIREDPTRPGRYIGVDAPEFYTHAAGQLIALEAPPGRAADAIEVEWLTPPSTKEFANPGADSTGHYRNPQVLANGTTVAIHTGETGEDYNVGTRAAPQSRYDFRLKTLRTQAGYLVPDQPLTAGISKTVSYWDPDVLVTYSGPLWELDPVEVRPRPRPPLRNVALPAPEAAVFAAEGVDVAAFRAYLEQHDLALAVTRDVTSRDRLDRQQPFNLKVHESAHQTLGAPGKVYEVAYLQFFQADQIRGIRNDPERGRRVLAQPMHDPAVANPPSTGPAGSAVVAADGSVAAFVPAHRAMSWQLTDDDGTPVVRERNWISFQPGEVRVCGSCHGVSSRDQANATEPTNQPQALRSLLQFWKANLAPGVCVADGDTLCLGGGRYRVEATWTRPNGQSGQAHAVPLTADTGLFWFFSETNLEMVVKVLAACGVNQHDWVFAGGLTNVQVVTTVTDTASGAVRTYSNPQGTAFAPLQDTEAFACAGATRVATGGR
jgi:hypothetical protein